MSLFEVIGIAMGLAMDAFSIAVACSIVLGKVSSRQVFRIAFHFGLFQGLMPILGWTAGLATRSKIEAWDHWIAFALLAGIGGKALYESLHEQEEPRNDKDPTRGMTLVLFSLATSIDALAAGVSLAAIRVEIWEPALIIGLITSGLCVLGMLLGSRLGALVGRRIEALGGLILIVIGVKILLAHTLLA